MTESLEPLKTALADRYIIERELGAGGMATVYLAEDRKHHRKVAVKILHTEVASALGAERFVREIDLAAGLQHPHILPVYDSGDAAGFLFYVMPYVEGESLRDRLNREKQLPVANALEIAREVASGLSHAHGHGVLHRDIKPENILLSGDATVVADFGIARAIMDAGGERLTETGITVGTPNYMSPEQASGEELDGRSDIYALGCVLYEMLAGQPPFTGPTVQSVMSQHLAAEPPSVRTVRPALSEEISGIITRALAKTPADRHGTAEVLASDLRAAVSGGTREQSVGAVLGHSPWKRGRSIAVAVGVLGIALVAGAIYWFGVVGGEGGDGGVEVATPVDANVVAVFPFRTAGADPSLTRYREGMIDLLHARLTGGEGPRAVDPGAIVAALRRAQPGVEGDLPRQEQIAIAARLGAGRLLAGSLVGSPGNLEVNASLWGVPSGELIGTASVRGEEDGLAGRLPDRLLIELLGAQIEAGGWGLCASLPALRALLAGQQAARDAQYAQAIEQHDRALAADPDCALAALGRLELQEIWGITGTITVSEELGPERAWELRDRLSERDRAHLAALVLVSDPGRSAVADRIEAWQAALQAAPDRASSAFWLGRLLTRVGQQVGFLDWDRQAAAALDRAIGIDSAFAPAIGERLRLAARARDTALVRRLGALYQAIDFAGETAPYHRWLVAVVGDDSAALRETQSQICEWPYSSVNSLGYASVLDGHRIEDWERGVECLTQRAITPRERWLAQLQRRQLAGLRGRLDDALQLTDSVVATSPLPEWWPWGAQTFFEYALPHPGVARALAWPRAYALAAEDTSTNAMCHRELWRVTQGDTASTRAIGARLVGSDWESCAMLFDAMLAGVNPAALPGLERLDSLSRRGAISEIGNLLLARLWYAQGEIERALAAARRRGLWGSTPKLQLPAFLREEGRLAALSGDTVGAIRVYERYLELRTEPDPGPAQAQVDSVRKELRALRTKTN
jgi:serine/threonine-protein kinase